MKKTIIMSGTHRCIPFNTNFWDMIFSQVFWGLYFYLFVRLLQVFHEDGNYHVDQHKLCHEHKNHKK